MKPIYISRLRRRLSYHASVVKRLEGAGEGEGVDSDAHAASVVGRRDGGSTAEKGKIMRKRVPVVVYRLSRLLPRLPSWRGCAGYGSNCRIFKRIEGAGEEKEGGGGGNEPRQRSWWGRGTDNPCRGNREREGEEEAPVVVDRRDDYPDCHHDKGVPLQTPTGA